MAKTAKRVMVDDKIIGHRLAKDVYTKNSFNIFIRRESIVTPYVYKRFLDEGIWEVFVYEDVEESPLWRVNVDPKFEEFKKGYIVRAVKLNTLFDEVVTKKNLNIEETSQVCIDIIKSSTDKYNVFMFLDSLRSVDDYLYSHSVNVATLAGLFGKWLNFSEYDLECLTMCGLLHDIGKTRVNVNILNKPQKLTDFEFSEIKSHALRGYELLKPQDVSDKVKEVAYMHHEKIDGLGYPRGLKKDQISEYARIIAIIDIYDAMSHARVYRKEIYSPFHILKEFQEGVYGKLDLEFLSVFMQNVAYMFVGSKCKLSDGREGKIVFVNPTVLYAPIVEVDNKMINLQFERNLRIDRILTN